MVMRIFIGLLISLLAAAPTYSRADAGADELQLRHIMRQLGEDLQTITDGMMREDWAVVATTAKRVAEHPQPGALEKARVLLFVGTDAPHFRRYDHATHKAALALAQAAERGDGMAAIEAMRDVQRSCHGCHAAFRLDFLRHFYPQQDQEVATPDAAIDSD